MGSPDGQHEHDNDKTDGEYLRGYRAGLLRAAQIIHKHAIAQDAPEAYSCEQAVLAEAEVRS